MAQAPRPPGPKTPWVSLVAILALAAAVRLWGVRWGLPGATHLFSYHPDEFHSLRGALALLLTGDPNPHFFNYGSLYLYLAAIAANFTGTMPLNPPTAASMGQLFHDWTLAARMVSVLAGVLTVSVTYALGRSLLSPRAGLLAALLLALMPLHVLNSDYATVDVTLTLFVSLTLLFAVRLARWPTPRDYLLAGLWAGLAASTKYSGGLVIVAPLVAHCVARRRRGPEGASAPPVRLVSLWPLAMIGVMLVAFAATSPYTLLDWQNARRDIVYEMQHMKAGEQPARSADPNGWLFQARGLAMSTAGAALVALLGLGGLSARRSWRPALGALVYGALWFAISGAAGVRYLRYELPLTPLLAVLAAAAPLASWQRRSATRAPGVVLTAAAVVAAAFVSFHLGQALATTPDPRDQARDSIIRLAPPDRTVGMVWEPWFQSPPLDPCNGGQVLRRNPLWRQFSQPVRPLVFLGLDATALRRQQPLVVVTSNFEVRDWQRVGDTGAQAFARDLREYYSPAAVTERRAPLAGVLGWQPPQDWLYAFPTINVYLSRRAERPLPSG